MLKVEQLNCSRSIEGVARRHGLVAGGKPSVVLRAVPDEIWSIVRRRVAPIAVVLTDLAEYSDARARRVAYGRGGRLDRECALAAVSTGD
jgi:hypothetical protein